MYKPPEFTGHGPFPLIVFLHGFGERHPSGVYLLGAGLGPSIPTYVKEHGTFDFVVLFPLDPTGMWRPESEAAINLFELLDYVVKRHRIDPDRIYLSGHSNGGNGVWQIAAHDPDRWAALVPLCAAFPTNQVRAVRGIPCWAFQGDADPEVPVGQVREMVDALRQAGGKVRYTEIPKAHHIIWRKVYSNPELYRWLAVQRKSSS
jgi:predicted peptidase